MQGIIIENIANLYQVKPIEKTEREDENKEKPKSCPKGSSPVAEIAKQARNRWQDGNL